MLWIREVIFAGQASSCMVTQGLWVHGVRGLGV